MRVDPANPKFLIYPAANGGWILDVLQDPKDISAMMPDDLGAVMKTAMNTMMGTPAELSQIIDANNSIGKVKPGLYSFLSMAELTGFLKLSFPDTEEAKTEE